MKEIIIHAGFHPEVKREYNGEHIRSEERRVGKEC